MNIEVFKVWLSHDGKGFEICTAGLEFESERASLIRD